MTLVQFYYDPIIEFDRLFEDALAARSCARACAPAVAARHETASHHGVYRPRLNLHESKETNTVTATLELPGLTADNITIDVHRNRLTVSGDSTAPPSEEEKNHVIRERRSGKFSRTLQLPFGTTPEDVKAKFENGVLTLTFPRTHPQQEAQRIAIQ